MKVEGAIYYSKVKDAIGEIALSNDTNQNQNIDTAEHKGFEMAAAYFPIDILELGGNYSYIKAKYKNKSDKIYDLPEHKAFVYVD